MGPPQFEYRLDSNNSWRIDLEDIREKMDENVRLLVLINPNNPTGNVATKDEIEQLLKITRDFPRCTVISDEIYDGLDFSGDFVSTASMSDHCPVITLNGVSKVYFCSWLENRYMAWHDPSGVLEYVKDGVERIKE